MGKKKKRIQPRPKKKKANRVSKEKTLDAIRKTMADFFENVKENRPEVDMLIKEQIDNVIEYFQKYDKVLLLGGLGLKLIANTPNMESAIMDVWTHIHHEYDDDAEAIMEYALSFGAAIQGNATVKPTQHDIDELYFLLKKLKREYSVLEVCDNYPELEEVSLIRMLDKINFMNVRGEGYMQHIEEVYEEMFSMHDTYFLHKFGCTSQHLLDFIKSIDNKVLSKFGTVLGVKLAHERWCEWDEQHADLSDIISNMNGNEHVPFIVGFLKDNPDLAGDGHDLNKLTTYQTTDFQSSYNIFWTVPKDSIEESFMEALSMEFGDNQKFIANNAYKGNIANVSLVSEKPFIKFDGRYFLFSVLLCYRNLFKIVENFLKTDQQYYQNHFLGNKYPECRDNYMERKSKELLEFLLPKAKFYSSAKYVVTDECGKSKETELDILGITDEVIFVVEVKAHKLTDNDKRAGGKGLMSKLKDSVGYAAYQCNRAKKFIESTPNPTFVSDGCIISIDKSKIKHIYKIVTTFEHFSAVICDMKNLIKEGVMLDEYKDTWVVSVFDLMVVAEYCQNSSDFINYLNLREKVVDAEVLFCDELDLFAAYCQGKLKEVVESKHGIVFDLAKMFDKDYNSEILGTDIFEGE